MEQLTYWYVEIFAKYWVITLRGSIPLCSDLILKFKVRNI